MPVMIATPGTAPVDIVTPSNPSWNAATVTMFPPSKESYNSNSLAMSLTDNYSSSTWDDNKGLGTSLVPSKSADHHSKLWPAAVRWGGMELSPVFGVSFTPNTRPKLAFLARFTSTDGMANSFDCGDTQQRREIMLFLLHAKQRVDYGTTGSMIPHTGPSEQYFEIEIPHGRGSPFLPSAWGKQYELPLIGEAFEADDSLHAHTPAQDWTFDVSLSLKTREIVHGIREVVQHKPQKSSISITWSESREMLCYRFFSPENIERFLLAFWAMWYPNWPVFHKPTFFAAQKPATLLAAMVLIGASLTSESTDRDQAMVWADSVEEWVFNSDAFCDDNIPRTDDEFEEYQIAIRLDALRAAYSVVLFLTWEGSVKQKSRARRVRYSQVIGVARSLRFPEAKHNNLGTYLHGTDQLGGWKTFILKEELIRTLIYVFMLDCAYVMFNNCPPRMASFELRCDLACPEVCFQAETLEAWQQCVQIWSSTHIGHRRPLLSEVIDIMARPSLSKEELTTLQQMSSLNFFAVANVYHNLIFHHHCGPTPTAEVAAITSSFANWRRLWMRRQLIPGLLELQPRSPGDAWKRVGFMQYAQEFWNLAYIIYKHPVYMQKMKIDGNQGPGGALRKGLLQSFDESNMGQVHELIMQFRDFNFGEG
ncbi:hypothetical protein BX600DRAFT_285056 [Xylariales sp. PMI_506]|nr:hypothetical protein BX600DRAFT_285056 [Xylariales sp. PMI_506]